jgi:hypothetical protein
MRRENHRARGERESGPADTGEPKKKKPARALPGEGVLQASARPRQYARTPLQEPQREIYFLSSGKRRGPTSK